MSQTSSSAQQQLKRLGAGGAEDRLRFRLVLKVMVRCLPLLKVVKWHLVGIILSAATLALSLLRPVFRIYDMFWTRVLKGDAPVDAKQIQWFKAFGIAIDPWNDGARMHGLRALVAVSALLALIAAVGFLALYYYRIWILQRINQVLRMRLLERLQTLSLRFHNDSSVGDTLYRMYQDSAMVTELIDVLLLMPLQNFGRLLLSVGLVAMFDGRLALLLCAGWPVSLFIGYRLSRRMRVGFRGAREHNSALTSLIQSSLQGIRVIKAYGAERAEQARFEQASEAAFARAYAARSLLAYYRVGIWWLFGALVVCATAWGAAFTMRGQALSATMTLLFAMSVWNLGGWNQFKARIGDGMRSSINLFELWGRMQDIAIGLDRVFELLDLEPEVQDAPDAVALAPFTQAIEFDRVGFSYDGTRSTLDDVSLTVRPGTITAVVGPTGSGKSTLMALLLRLYDPNVGEIRIDGLSLKRLKVQSLRENIAIALQENLLFGTTVRDNIGYAVPNASDAAVREAARVAGADEFIERLPDGYDTMLGERGQKLSTGQRQRLSIARAIMKDTPILILDEPTAALDAVTELRVLDNLAAWGKGRAIFLITHRLSTIRRADQVAVIEDGRLIEHGPHQTLMGRSGGAYRRLVEGEEAAARALPQAVAT